MPVSRQLRDARKLLRWSTAQTSALSGVPVEIIERAERGEGAPDLTLVELARIHAAYEAAGVAFGVDGTVALVPKP